ncbi:hypothetical protein GF322_04390 [Candidatus Dependentiae bacterium]|nr:hypothetical protein [Candidatus Dependentiae bacterium]
MKNLKKTRVKIITFITLTIFFFISNNLFASKDYLNKAFSSYDLAYKQEIEKLEKQKKQYVEDLQELEQLIDQKSSDELIELILEKSKKISPQNPSFAPLFIPKNYELLDDASKNRLEKDNVLLNLDNDVAKFKKEIQKNKIAYELLSYVESDETTFDVDYDKQEFAELKEINAIDNTYTKFGKLYILDVLADFTRDGSDLSENHKIIKFLMQNEEFFTQLEKFLSALAVSTDFYLDYYCALKNDFESKTVQQQVNTLINSLNKFNYYFMSPAWDATKQTTIDVASTFIFSLAFISIFKSVDFVFNTEYFQNSNSLFDNVSSCLTFDPYLNALQNWKLWSAVILQKLLFENIKSGWIKLPLSISSRYFVPKITGISNYVFPYVTAPIKGVLYFVSNIKNSWIKKKHTFDEIKPCIQNTKLLVKSLEGIGLLLSQKQENEQQLGLLGQDIREFLNEKNQKNNKLFELMNLYESDNSNEVITTATFISMLDSLINEVENKSLFIKALRSMGKLDALQAVAKYYKNNTNNMPSWLDI